MIAASIEKRPACRQGRAQVGNAVGHAVQPRDRISRLPARLLVAAVCVCLVSFAAAAQDYPNRPITLMVPFPAGGGVDVVGRIVAEKLTAALGQQVVVDNRGGAAGVIGTRLAAKAAPDGYTLVMTTSGTVAINPTLYAN